MMHEVSEHDTLPIVLVRSTRRLFCTVCKTNVGAVVTIPTWPDDPEAAVCGLCAEEILNMFDAPPTRRAVSRGTAERGEP